MDTLSASEFDDLLPGYVLGILDAEELAQVEAYLETCPDCLERIREFEQAVALLPYAAPDAPALDPSVKQRTLDAIRAEKTGKSVAVPAIRQQVAQPVPAPSLWDRLRQALATGWAPALAVAALLLAVWFGVRLSSTQTELAQAQLALTAQQNRADIARLTTTLAQAHRDNQALAQAVQQQIGILSRANNQIRMDATPDAPANASARVYLTPDDRAVVLADGLKPLAANRVYELWGIQGNTPVPVGTYTVDNQGRGAWLVENAPSLSNFQAFGVTEEPSGGSQTPTLPILLLGARAS